MNTFNGRWLVPCALALVAGGCNLVFSLEHHELNEGEGGSGGASATGATSSTASNGGPSCSDGKKDGLETDKDCGGTACDPCADTKGCFVGPDCMSKVCVGGTCIAASCTDQVKNGAESDV